ncbi:hypothetical protein NGM37_11715, partial [Streptomyces sp. TRM76130]|nr:hypothetical protein [Streptomyces sp. TRM76130]
DGHEERRRGRRSLHPRHSAAQPLPVAPDRSRMPRTGDPWFRYDASGPTATDATAGSPPAPPPPPPGQPLPAPAARTVAPVCCRAHPGRRPWGDQEEKHP